MEKPAAAIRPSSARASSAPDILPGRLQGELSGALSVHTQYHRTMKCDKACKALNTVTPSIMFPSKCLRRRLQWPKYGP